MNERSESCSTPSLLLTACTSRPHVDEQDGDEGVAFEGVAMKVWRPSRNGTAKVCPSAGSRHSLFGCGGRELMRFFGKKPLSVETGCPTWPVELAQPLDFGSRNPKSAEDAVEGGD